MVSYKGNGSYCYSNSASMLLSTISEEVSPSLIEVLTGFSLGASIEDGLLFFDNSVTSPDVAINAAFHSLGFSVNERVSKDGGELPLEEFSKVLSDSPIMVGPVDMGFLTYLPNHKYLSGSDHYVLALEMNNNEVLLHDPHGYPFVSLPLNQLDLAWKSDKIQCRKGPYHYWFSPKKESDLSEDEIFLRAIKNFKTIYINQEKVARESKVLFGREAINIKANEFRNKKITDREMSHLIYFAFPVSARRSQDFAKYFNNREVLISTLKEKQSRLFGKCQTLATQGRLEAVGDTLEILADIEEQIKDAILKL
ncbi:hypothetical protein KQI89_07695 [Clostridium sp. MSJ-4]|uniref:Butirosin biosynthesis protein H N-terminal domain-containing protein n=1 Tax=Clostridium simiarum TaxID=2841506 RepID=A0ABS6EZJ3_9CLOT|nr:hypothetical protein [Clostridium simiarum]MBU5591646.1 hypothetical protein [Clostridium simiarum]